MAYFINSAENKRLAIIFPGIYRYFVGLSGF